MGTHPPSSVSHQLDHVIDTIEARDAETVEAYAGSVYTDVDSNTYPDTYQFICTGSDADAVVTNVNQYQPVGTADANVHVDAD